MSSPPVTLSPLPSPGLEAPASMASSPSRSSKSNPDGRFPYDLSRWNAVDDRVRGGSSVSHLDAVKGGVRFWGTLGECVRTESGWMTPVLELELTSRSLSALPARLRCADTQTLGGAGFASQSYTFLSPLSLPLALYTGLLVELLPRPATDVSSADPLADVEKGHPAKPSKITVVLKIEEPKRRTDGRNEAVTSWEAEFDINDVYASAYAPADTGLYEKPARVSTIRLVSRPSIQLETDHPLLLLTDHTDPSDLVHQPDRRPLDRPALARLILVDLGRSPLAAPTRSSPPAVVVVRRHLPRSPSRARPRPTSPPTGLVQDRVHVAHVPVQLCRPGGRVRVPHQVDRRHRQGRVEQGGGKEERA